MALATTETLGNKLATPASEVVATKTVMLIAESAEPLMERAPLEEDSFVLPAPRNYKPLAEPVVVISHKFLAPYPVDLTIVEKVLKLSDGNFEVKDVNGNVVFKVEGKFFTLHNRRIVKDAAGNPIVSLENKILTAHNRWNAYKRDSSDPKDLVFTAKASHLIELKTGVDVFLPNNTEEEKCDFKLKGSFSESYCTIYAGDSIIAQMHKKNTAQSMLLGKTTSSVTVYPNVDFAFIVALLVTLHETDNSSN